jgi:dipeptidyl aminopeptidase/acylaminoacyl peptidase
MQRVWRGQLWKERLGQNERALWQMSPLSRTSTIEIPVLLVHGRLDPVVPVTQARRFVRALRLSNKRHHFIERSDCDHDLTIESCRLVFYGELRTFLAGAIGDVGL